MSNFEERRAWPTSASDDALEGLAITYANLHKEARDHGDHDLESTWDDELGDIFGEQRRRLLESLKRNDDRQFIVTLTADGRIRFDPKNALRASEQLVLGDLNHRIRSGRELNILLPLDRLKVGEQETPYWIVGILVRDDHDSVSAREVAPDGR